MKRKMKPKELKFLEYYLDGKPLADCAEHAGYKGKNRNNLAQMGYQTLKALDISLPEIMELHGLTDDLLARKTLEGLNAKKVEVATFRGKIGQVKAFDDYSTRAKYVELAGRFKGKFVDKHELTGKDGGDISLVIAPAGSRASGRKHTLEIDD